VSTNPVLLLVRMELRGRNLDHCTITARHADITSLTSSRPRPTVLFRAY